jgi:hypothetical protein
MAYDRVNILPEQRGAALISSVIANVMGNSKRRITEADFLPTRRRTVEMDDSEMFANLRSIVPSPEG